MRNALVVLVPVCIRLSSGFIVPSSVQETTESIINEKHAVKQNINENILQKNQRFIRTSNVTNNNVNTTQGIDVEKINNAIYEHINKKDVNLTERSFIYIQNQRSRMSGQRFNRKNKDRSYFVSIKNIFDDLHHRFSLGHVDRNIFNTRNIFDVSRHRCKGKSNYATENNNNSQSKDQEEIFKFFGIPITLYDLEDIPQNEKAVEDIKQTSYLNNLFKTNPYNEKRLHREPNSKDEYEQRKINEPKINNIHETLVPSDDRSNSDEYGDEILDYLMNKVIENQIPKNKNYIIRNGFHYCRDCIEENLSNISSDTNCTCDLKKM